MMWLSDELSERWWWADMEEVYHTDGWTKGDSSLNYGDSYLNSRR